MVGRAVVSQRGNGPALALGQDVLGRTRLRRRAARVPGTAATPRAALGRGLGDPTGLVERAWEWRDLGRPGNGSRRQVASLEVLAAPGAQGPVETDQAAAVGADAVQARPAGGTDDPLVVDATGAGRAALDRLDLGEERLLGQVPL